MLYVHVTTRLEGRPRDGLLREMGFTGFPSIGMLDGGGALIARHTDARTIDGIETTEKKAAKYLALRQQAEQGDAAAAQHLFVQNLGLGHYTFSTGSLALDANRKGMPEELLRRAQQSLTDLQYAELTGELRGKLPGMDRTEYSRKWSELAARFFRAGRIPSGYQGTGMLSTVLRHAKTIGDAELMAGALAAFEQRVGNDSRYARTLDSYRSALEELKKK